MKNVKITSLSLVLGSIMSVSAAHAWTNLDLNANGNLSDTAYQGSFTFYDNDANGQPDLSTGVTYGPSGSGASQSTFDLNQLQVSTLYGKDGANGHGHNDNTGNLVSNDGTYPPYPGAPVVYRIYKQNHSAAVVNLSRGTGPRDFVKSVVGDATTVNPYVVQGDYHYAGVAFSNFPRGNFNYTVNVATNNAVTGSGSFTLNDIKIPASQSSTGQDIFFDITHGQLLSTALTVGSNGLEFNGDAYVDPNTGVSNAAAWVEIDGHLATAAYYDLKAFGPNGEELAGAIHGLPSRVGSVAIIAAQTAQP